jgi:hypothetical protein
MGCAVGTRTQNTCPSTFQRLKHFNYCSGYKWLAQWEHAPALLFRGQFRTPETYLSLRYLRSPRPLLAPPPSSIRKSSPRHDARRTSDPVTQLIKFPAARHRGTPYTFFFRPVADVRNLVEIAWLPTVRSHGSIDIDRSLPWRGLIKDRSFLIPTRGIGYPKFLRRESSF